MKFATIALGAAAAVVLSAGAATATWMVVDGGDASATGQCATATYSLEAEREDGALEVSFELQSDEPRRDLGASRSSRTATSLLEGERPTDEDAEIDVDVYAPEDGERRVHRHRHPATDGARSPAPPR